MYGHPKKWTFEKALDNYFRSKKNIHFINEILVTCNDTMDFFYSLIFMVVDVPDNFEFTYESPWILNIDLWVHKMHKWPMISFAIEIVTFFFYQPFFKGFPFHFTPAADKSSLLMYLIRVMTCPVYIT